MSYNLKIESSSFLVHFMVLNLMHFLACYTALIPKEVFVPTNLFWVASLDLILFLDFLKLFMNMRLRLSFARVQIS
jgi:hypothetical protein